MYASFIIKKKLLAALELTPFGRDFYLWLSRNRLTISYRGVFTNFDMATNEIPSGKINNYDLVNIGKSEKIEQERKGLDSWFHDTDYPVLFWFAQLLREKSVVLELGGSVGHSFYSFEKYIQYPEKMKWYIAELSEAIKLGRFFADERNEKRLLFINSERLCDIQSVDIFFTAGTLQYVGKTLRELLQDLQVMPRHVIVHNLPCHSHKSFWTIQNLGVCEVPYHIYSKQELLNDMSDLGFETVGYWKKDRIVEIPFYSDISIEGYLGYYFRLSD